MPRTRYPMAGIYTLSATPKQGRIIIVNDVITASFFFLLVEGLDFFDFVVTAQVDTRAVVDVFRLDI